MALYLLPPGSPDLDSGIRIDYLISDNHFLHTNISVLADRPFDNSVSTKIMDDTMAERWNSCVKPDDVVLHLGDFGMGQRHLSVPVAARLNGRKLLIPGNHDKVSSVFSANQREQNREIYEEHFEVLKECGNYLTTVEGNYAEVSHYPFAGSEDHVRGRKFDKLQVLDRGDNLLVHGHTHSPVVINGRMFHVGVDAHDFYPVAASVVESWIDTMTDRIDAGDVIPCQVGLDKG